MDCPKCALPLEAAHLPTKVTVDYCAKCGGAFYDAREIRISLDEGLSKETAHACPKCRSLMVTMEHFNGRLTLEHCGSCSGLWFDSGEVLKLKELAGVEDVVGPDPHQAADMQNAPAKEMTSEVLLSALYDVAAAVARTLIDGAGRRGRRRRYPL